jgi:anti-sigma factor RsiW
MTSIQPEELSALLDGELPPARAAEIRRALADNPVLAAQFDELTAADRAWSATAKHAQFGMSHAAKPHPPAVTLSRQAVAALVLFLLLIRLATKLPTPFILSLVIQSIALAGLLAIVILISRKTANLKSQI